MQDLEAMKLTLSTAEPEGQWSNQLSIRILLVHLSILVYRQ